jgi:hypothetical protein
MHGNLAGTPPNLTYTPNPGFVGLDGFQYFVRDAQATSDPATITINVKHGLSINNISVTEGNGGTTAPTFAIFTVTKSGVSAAPVSFSLRTADGTSRAGSDYQAIRFIGLTIPANQTSATVGLAVTGDRLFEFNESFLVQLFSPGFNAAIVSGIGRCTIVDDDGVIARDVGTSALMPENSVVAVGEPVNLSLTWTHPVGWRQLNSVDLLLVDDESEILRLRWHEGENSFSLFNPNAERFVRTAEAGSTTRFQTSAATLFLRQSTGGGPPGHTVTINFNLSFALQTAGRTFSIEAFATDDAGNQQGFESVGTLTVLPR